MLDMQKKLTNSFYAILSLPATAMGFALAIQISALSWILSSQYGLEIHDVGLVWAAGPIAGILGQIIFGVLSDRVWFWNGRRRPFIFIGGFLAAIMLLALPNLGIISSSLGFEGILGVAIAVALSLDLSINVGFNPTRSIIADVTPEGVERTKGYSWMQTISGTFGVLAYVIGAVWNNYVLIYVGVMLVFLLSVLPPFFIEEPKDLDIQDEDEFKEKVKKNTSFLDVMNYIQPLWGFLIYSAYALIAKLIDYNPGNYYVEILCFIITLFFIIKVLLRSSDGLSKSEAGIVGFKKVLAAHSFTWIGIQTMFIYMFAYVQHEVYGFPDNAAIDEATNIEMGRVVSISFLLLNAVGALLPVFVLEPIARKIGKVKTHATSIAIMAIGYIGMLIFGFSPTVIYILMIILGVGWAATISLPFAIMSQKVDKAKMGLFMGLFNLSVVLPQLVASFGVGQAVSSAEDKNLVFIIASFTLSVSALLWFMVKEEKADLHN
ncbi:MAG: MFS transporter [Melioribacteraceae bacterium]|nr:MFS transporter [Melioribacteraceae bacterium]MCF8355181.1 MFS transporter [Melioribacteraceae bacterium]MCF8395394.1 MFS transporter [Melioribacteraceae bacterium]MCF8419900.1 MFS transporter [Melioribacteraceae bacterium]